MRRRFTRSDGSDGSGPDIKREARLFKSLDAVFMSHDKVSAWAQAAAKSVPQKAIEQLA